MRWADHIRRHDRDRDDDRERRDEHQRQHTHEAAARATAERRMDERLRGINEIRQAMSDQARLLLPREEYDLRHKALVARVDAHIERVFADIDELRGKVANMQAERQGVTSTFRVLAAVVTLAVAVLTVVVFVVR